MNGAVNMCMVTFTAKHVNGTGNMKNIPVKVFDLKLENKTWIEVHKGVIPFCLLSLWINGN